MKNMKGKKCLFSDHLQFLYSFDKTWVTQFLKCCHFSWEESDGNNTFSFKLNMNIPEFYLVVKSFADYTGVEKRDLFATLNLFYHCFYHL